MGGGLRRKFSPVRRSERGERRERERERLGGETERGQKERRSLGTAADVVCSLRTPAPATGESVEEGGAIGDGLVSVRQYNESHQRKVTVETPSVPASTSTSPSRLVGVSVSVQFGLQTSEST